MAASRRRVLLLKGTVQAGEGRSLDDEDGTAYCNVLAATGLVVEVLAPLTVAYIHEDALRRSLEGAAAKYAAVLFTSPRAVDAVARAVAGTEGLAQCFRTKGWPVYAVGAKTAEALRLALGVEARGAAAGRAAVLAPIMVADLAGADRPVLFLAGDKALPTMPTQLAAGGLRVEQLCVYETQPRPDLVAALEAYAAGAGHPPAWVGAFSPSGVYAARPVLDAWARQATRFAAIGPTTAAALVECSLVAAAVAEAPTPAGLAAAIAKAEQQDAP